MKERIAKAQERAKVAYLLGDMYPLEAKEVVDAASIDTNLDRYQTADKKFNNDITENCRKRDKQFEK